MITFYRIVSESGTIFASCKSLNQAEKDKLFYESLYKCKCAIVTHAGKDNRW